MIIFRFNARKKAEQIKAAEEIRKKRELERIEREEQGNISFHLYITAILMKTVI